MTFTRFDLIAVAIPGAILTLLIAYETDPGRIDKLTSDPKQFELGALGLLAIVAFCVGQILQALAAFQAMVNRRSEGKSESLQLCQPYLKADFLRDKYASRLQQLGYPDPKSMTHGYYRENVHRYVVAYVRRAKVHRQLEDAYVQYGLNRGLGAAFLLLVIFTLAKIGIDRTPFTAQTFFLVAGFVVLAVVTMMNASRYARNFERELAYALITDGEASPSESQ